MNLILLFSISSDSRTGYSVLLTVAILSTETVMLLEYPLDPHSEMFTEPAVKNENSRFFRNCASLISLSPLGDNVVGRGMLWKLSSAQADVPRTTRLLSNQIAKFFNSMMILAK